MAEEPEYFTYELRGGQFDGFEGRESRPRLVVHRPSRTDARYILVYRRSPSFVDGDDDPRHSVYQFSHEALAILVTEQDG